MVSAFVVSSEVGVVQRVSADLVRVGIAVTGGSDVAGMVEAVIRAAPAVLVCSEAFPDDAFFEGIETLNRSAPRPTVVFTTDPDVDRITRATQGGVHAYEVGGYEPGRLRAVIHVAQARFRHVEALRAELADVHHRFSERKLVDQAKAVLMRLRNLPEEDAYAALRTTAMKANKRMGQVARRVIDGARTAEAVNRAGQLRMTSQRLVKLYALRCAPEATDDTGAALAETLARMDANMALLGRNLSKPTFGDLLHSVAAPLVALREALAPAPALARLPDVDALAEAVLTEAERLTTALEGAGFPSALRLINVAGRQRMLGQRYAKQALLAALLEGAPARTARADMDRVAEHFHVAGVYLDAVPLMTPAIGLLLARAAAAWAGLQAAAPAAASPEGRRTVADTSETLLTCFEELTSHYERSLQALLDG